jgi:hypothetical protein
LDSLDKKDSDELCALLMEKVIWALNLSF